MKVRQLINILALEDQDLEVKIAIDENCNEIFPILNVISTNNDTEIVIVPNEFERTNNVKLN